MEEHFHSSHSAQNADPDASLIILESHDFKAADLTRQSNMRRAAGTGIHTRVSDDADLIIKIDLAAILSSLCLLPREKADL